GTVGTLVVAAFAVPLTRLVFSFGAPEYFSLIIVGLVGAVVLASGSVIKAIAMILVGILIGMVGADVNSGAIRFTFGFEELWDGVDLIIVAVGLFSLAEIVVNLESRGKRETASGK